MCKATAGDMLNQCHNVTSKIRDAISAYISSFPPRSEYKQHHKCLKDRVEWTDFVLIMETKRKMEELVKLQPELDNVDLKTIQLVEGADKSTDAENILLMMPILLMYSIIFRTASLKGIEFDKLFWRLIH